MRTCRPDCCPPDLALRERFTCKRVSPAKETNNASNLESTAESRRRRACGKRGEQPKSKLKGASRQMEKSMSEQQLEEFASTKRKGLPNKKD